MSIQAEYYSIALFARLSFLLLLHQSLATNANPHRILFDAIYQFGDSISDTGNRVRIDAMSTSCSRSPYGKTFFHHPSGRCSDGLLTVDFIANAFGLPFLNPYLDTTADFSHGVNFAVGGATALDGSDLAARNISTRNHSLLAQVEWFRTHRQSICSSSYDCKIEFQRSLFLMGEIGANDINYSFLQGKSIEFVYSLIPEIIQAIKNAVEDIIVEGATYIVVPGNLPLGCMPTYHWIFASNDSSKYDDMKCLKAINELVQFQNDKLQQAITELQKQHPNVVITYGDYYNASLWLLENASSLGFEEDQVFNPCCGTQIKECGSQGAPLCANAKTRLSWDGTHPTHEANKRMADRLLS